MNQRTFVIGDIHGAYKALIQLLKKVEFDYDVDKLIALGDVCDGWSEVPESIEELLKIKNLIYIKGNHDDWAYNCLIESKSTLKYFSPEFLSWMYNGGRATLDAYKRRPDLLDKHIAFLNNARLYYLDEKNRLFVHAGIKPGLPIDKMDKEILLWDRNFCMYQYDGLDLGIEYKEIYIGHTPTLIFNNQKKPINCENTWFLDTGAAFTGYLTIMNIDTKEYWQSEEVRKLYPSEKGRNKKSWEELSD